MKRKAKALGLALVVVVAISAVGAQGASAVNFTSPEAGSGTTVLTVKQHVNKLNLTTHAGSRTCETVNLSGSQVGTSFASVEVTAEYKECLFAGVPATVSMNECRYKFYATGVTDVVCPAGKEITITSSQAGIVKCITHIPAQTAKGTITYTNVGSGTTREITAHVAITGLNYSQTEGTGLGKCETKDNTTTGTYTGTVTVTGETTGGVHTGVLID